jgi:hypothetical protein
MVSSLASFGVSGCSESGVAWLSIGETGGELLRYDAFLRMPGEWKRDRERVSRQLPNNLSTAQ